MDFRQNYALTSGEWRNNKLLARFHRRFDTCDPMDYAIDVSTNKSSSNTPFVFQTQSWPLLEYNQLCTPIRVRELKKKNIASPPCDLHDVLNSFFLRKLGVTATKLKDKSKSLAIPKSPYCKISAFILTLILWE